MTFRLSVATSLYQHCPPSARPFLYCLFYILNRCPRLGSITHPYNKKLIVIYIIGIAHNNCTVIFIAFMLIYFVAIKMPAARLLIFKDNGDPNIIGDIQKRRIHMIQRVSSFFFEFFILGLSNIIVDLLKSSKKVNK